MLSSPSTRQQSLFHKHVRSRICISTNKRHFKNITLDKKPGWDRSFLGQMQTQLSIYKALKQQPGKKELFAIQQNHKLARNFTVSGLCFLINSKVRHRSSSQIINLPSMPFEINRTAAYVFTTSNFSSQSSKGHRIIIENDLGDAEPSEFLGMSLKLQTC